jgi:hypothetical protein
MNGAGGRGARLLLSVLAVALPRPLFPAEAGVETSGLFSAIEPLEIQVRAPWREMFREREAPEEHVGAVASLDADGSSTRIPARIRLRGVSRLERCDYPPLMLRFAAEAIESTPFAGQTVVHASVPCKRNRKYEEHTFQEYLAYRIYQVLTPESLRVRLVRLEFLDTGNGKAIGTVDAFLVEDFNLAAERLGMSRVTDHRVPRAALSPDAAALHSLFQYMIGHTDWSVVSGPPDKECCHNAILLGSIGGDAASDLVPIPFDFDASGLVNTGDMRPNPALGIHNVRQRLFRGFCAHNDALTGAIERVRQTRASVESLFDDAPDDLHRAARRRSWNFLNPVYEILSDPARVDDKIVSNCRER